MGDEEYIYEQDQQEHFDQDKYSIELSLFLTNFYTYNSLCMCLLIRIM